MSVGKRLSTDEPLTEHDIAARLDKAAERVFRIMLDARRLGLAEQVLHSRYLTHPTLGILRAELDLWGVDPAPFTGQDDPLTPEAQAVADAYSRWLSSYRPTGAPMSEQNTQQQPEGTVTTEVSTENADVKVDDAGQVDHDGQGDQPDAADTAASDSADDKQDGAQDGGSAE